MSHHPFRPLRHPAVRLLWGAAVLSDIGTWVQLIVVGSMVAKDTGSAVQTGLVALATFMPQSFASPIGGLLADRFDRKKVFAATLLAQAVATGALATVLSAGVRTPGVLTAFIMLSASAGALGQPSYTAIHPDLVDEDELVAMVSLITLSWNSGRIVGPLLASLLVAVASPAELVTFNAVTFVVLAIAIMRLDGRFVATTHEEGGVVSRLRSGWTSLWSTPSVAYVLSISLGLNVMVIPFMGLIPIYARSVFHGGTGLTGAIAAAQGTGALFGSVVVSSLAVRLRRSTLLTALLAGLCVALLLYGIAPNRWTVVGGAMLLGAISSATIIIIVSIAQRDAPSHSRGRVLSIFQAANGLTYGLGLLAIGALGDAFNLRLSFSAGATICLLYLAMLATRLPRWRVAFDGVTTPALAD